MGEAGVDVLWSPLMKQLHGHCLCGAVEYAVADNFEYVGFCHCSECRRFSGSAFSAVGGISTAEFRVLKGQEAIRHFPKSEHTVLGFCSICGSSLYAQKPLRDMVHLRLGTLNESPSLAPHYHSHVASKAPWHHIGDDLPQFASSRTAAVAPASVQADGLGSGGSAA